MPEHLQLKFMTLRGGKYKPQFLKEWSESERRLASFVQSRQGAIYLMPYGVYSETHNGEVSERFSGTYRTPDLVVRDFELIKPDHEIKKPEDRIDLISAGHLILKEDRRACIYGSHFAKIGITSNIPEIIFTVNHFLNPRNQN